MLPTNKLLLLPAGDRRRPAAQQPVAPTAFEPGFWECSIDGDWSPYAWPTSSLIEQAFCQAHSAVVFSDRGQPYRIDFPKAGCMNEVANSQQVNTATTKARPVRRWPCREAKAQLGRLQQTEAQRYWNAWVKADNCWCIFEPGEIASATLPASGPFSEPYRLGDLAMTEVWWPDLLQRWSSESLIRALHPLGRTCNFSVRRVAPVSHDGEWAAISTLWANGGMKKADLVGALRVQSRPLLQSFAFARQAMLARHASEDDGRNSSSSKLQVKLLFHGTKKAAHLVDICNEGFDRALAQSCLYGKGCYFSTSASYSDKYACPVEVPLETRKLKAMLVAAVLVGEMAKGSNNMYPPPVKLHSRLGERYENTCDNPSSPSILVTFKDHQAVPAYVLVYAQSGA